MYVTIQSQGLQGCILHNLLPAFSVDLAACYLLRLELIWVQRKDKKPEITEENTMNAKTERQIENLKKQTRINHY